MPAPRCARGAGLLAATVDDKVVTDRPADASGAQNDVGFRDVLAQARTTHGLFVPLAFGFVDRLTAGFFALVGVYYFQDPETFGLSAGAAGATLALFSPSSVLQAPFGSLSDRVGRFLPVVLGSIAYGIVTIGVGVAPVYPVAAALMVLVGVCGALMAPATMALVTDLVEPEGPRRGDGTVQRVRLARVPRRLPHRRERHRSVRLHARVPRGRRARTRHRAGAVPGREIDRAGRRSPRTRRRDWAVALGVTLPPPDMRWCGRPSRAL